LSVNDTPLGSVPDAEREGVGTPNVVTVNECGAPRTNLVRSKLVMAGGPSTVRRKLWVASGTTPFAAMTLRG
jgi:hypothetical protein